MDVDYRAAYVPFVETRTFEAALLPAIEFVDAECQKHGMRGLLMTTQVPEVRLVPPLAQFFARHRNRVSLKGWKCEDSGPRPTLLYVPREELLEQATEYARGFSLCVVEYPDLRLNGWAAATGALNLDTNEPTAPPSENVCAILSDLIWAGNNGYADAPGNRVAKRLIEKLRSVDPSIDGAFLAGYVIGKGEYASGAKRLREMVK